MASIPRTKINTLIEIVLASQLPSDVFTFDPEISPVRFKFPLPLRVSHRFDEFYFDVDYGSNSYGTDCFVVTSFPGSGPLENEAYASDWDEVVSWFGKWIDLVKTEITQPDPCTLLRDGSILANQVPVHLEGDMFDPTDLQGLYEFIKAFRQFIISEANPTDTETHAIDERLAYLEHAANRQTKQDWAHLANGDVFTISIGLGLDFEQRQKLQALTLDFIRKLFRRMLT